MVVSETAGNSISDRGSKPCCSMQFAQRPGGAYALKANPHFPQVRVSAMEGLAAFRCCSRRSVPKANSQKCYSVLFKTWAPLAFETTGRPCPRTEHSLSSGRHVAKPALRRIHSVGQKQTKGTKGSCAAEGQTRTAASINGLATLRSGTNLP